MLTTEFTATTDMSTVSDMCYVWSRPYPALHEYAWFSVKASNMESCLQGIAVILLGYRLFYGRFGLL
jgi:hypothetical protein